MAVIAIPKRQKFHYANDLKLINICNVNYKIIFTVVTNELSIVLDSVVGPFQSAFVNER